MRAIWCLIWGALVAALVWEQTHSEGKTIAAGVIVWLALGMILTAKDEHRKARAAKALREQEEAKVALQRQIAFEAADRVARRLSNPELADEIERYKSSPN